MHRRPLLLALVCFPLLSTPSFGGAFDPGAVVVLDLTANKAILISNPGIPDASGANQTEVILNSGTVTFPRGGAFDPNGDLFVSGNSEIHRIKDTGAGNVADGFPQDWQFVAGGFFTQRDVVRDPDSGELFVANPAASPSRAITPIDPITGLTGNNVAQGLPMFFPTGLIWEGSSQFLPDHTSGKRSILVIDSSSGGPGVGLAVIRAFIDDDPTEGLNQIVLYQGEPFGVPRRGAIGLACDLEPVIFVTDSKGYNVSGVDSVVWQLRWSGTEWEVRGGPEPDLFLDQPLTSGGNLDRPIGIAQLPPQPPPPDEPLVAGDLLVADAASQALIGIDVCSGGQTIISAGNLFDKPWEVVIGGAFRFPRFGGELYDPDGPVFVPLSAIPQAARAQLDVARAVAGKGRRVLVKQHPMYPLAFDEGESLVRAERPLAEQRGLSAVLYTTGTSGLEAVLMGIPAYRLMLDDRIAIDVLPETISSCAVTPDTAVKAVLDRQSPPAPVVWDDILSEPDFGLWKSLLFGDIDAVI
ncbi:MAG: hypothetical protein IIA30_07020, partial [Myxococcales bacterium]|nr:hypothetical protein [Myxococcales bacterium]